MAASDSHTDSLFDEAQDASLSAPLAARMRPATIDQFAGQTHLLGAGKPLGDLARAGKIHSMLLWGPPGVGKTTLAKLLAEASGSHWIALSAVLAGIKDVRAAIAEAEVARAQGRATVLFVDEVHRFNKAQQDGFLPHVEKGTVTFIGATTENPSFEVNSALLSRTRVYVLKSLEEPDLNQIVDRALAEFLPAVRLAHDAREALFVAADGDGRRLLNLLEFEAAHRTPRCTGCAACSMVVLTRCMWRGDWSGWPPKILATQIRVACSWQ